MSATGIVIYYNRRRLQGLLPAEQKRAEELAAILGVMPTPGTLCGLHEASWLRDDLDVIAEARECAGKFALPGTLKHCDTEDRSRVLFFKVWLRKRSDARLEELA